MAPEPAMALARFPLQGQPQEGGGELVQMALDVAGSLDPREVIARILERGTHAVRADRGTLSRSARTACVPRSQEHTSELQSRSDLVCRLLLGRKAHNCSA